MQSFETADRPRCIKPDEDLIRRNRNFRKYDYGRAEYEQTTCYWNMNHQLANGCSFLNASKPNQKLKNAVYATNRSHSSSGFQSFIRWFKKDDKSRPVSDISYPLEVSSSTDTLLYENGKRVSTRVRHMLKNRDSIDNFSSSTSPRLSRAFSQNSSCDSVFSTASSFAFIPPVKYLNNRNQKQVICFILLILFTCPI